MHKILLLSCFIFLLSATAFGQSDQKASSDFGRMFPLSGDVINEYNNLYGLSEEGWYQHIKSATLRFNGGCSASFISASGLLVTAAHCTPNIELKDYNLRATVFNNGYLAKSLNEELPANGLKVMNLVQSVDVTEELRSMSKGSFSETYTNTLKGKYAQKEEFKGMYIEVKRYFNDNKIMLHAYKEYSDVRLVFVPRSKVRKMNSGSEGECKPSYDFDISFWRVYENGMPLNTSANHLKMNQFNTKKEEPVFIAGFPSRTMRYKSPAELAFLAKHTLKYRNENLNNNIEVLTEGVANKTEVTESDLVGQMCRIRAINALNNATNEATKTKFVFEKLNDPKTIDKVENDLQWSEEYLETNKELKKNYDELDKDAWALTYLSPSPRSTSWEVLFLHRLEKYRLAIENGESESKLTSLMQDAFSIGQSFGNEKSKVTIKSWLVSIEKDIDGKDSFLKDVLDGKTVEDYIDHTFANSGFGSYKVSKATMDDRALMVSNTNPIVILSSKIVTRYLDAKENYTQRKSEIDSLKKELTKLIYETLGSDMIPNADATLRLSDGVLSGYSYCGFEDDNTTFSSIIRSDATGELDQALLEKLPNDYRKRIAFISSTNDGTGGNSGSPMVNMEGEFIGLVFKQGNHSEFPNDYIYDGKNKAISVHAQAIFLCMMYIYGADDLMEEILSL